MTLTKAQNQQLEMLSDGKWHNQHNNGVRGLKYNSLKVLIKKGLVIKKSNWTGVQGVYTKSLSPDPEVLHDADYDNFYKLNN